MVLVGISLVCMCGVRNFLRRFRSWMRIVVILGVCVLEREMGSGECSTRPERGVGEVIVMEPCPDG